MTDDPILAAHDRRRAELHEQSGLAPVSADMPVPPIEDALAWRATMTQVGAPGCGDSWRYQPDARQIALARARRAIASIGGRAHDPGASLAEWARRWTPQQLDELVRVMERAENG